MKIYDQDFSNTKLFVNVGGGVASIGWYPGIKKITGFSIGGVPPIAHKIKIPTYIDINLKKFDNIFAAAGHPHCVFKINFENICKITNGYICDIVN